MKTTTLALRVLVTGSVLMSPCAVAAQVAQPVANSGNSQPASTSGSPIPSSNPWDSLPQMSVDRCLAEAIGTASDPNTGAPRRASVDPETGKPLCPPTQPSNVEQPPR